MKQITIIILCFSLTYVQAQVSIEKEAPEGDALLDFDHTQQKGLLLPYVTDVTEAPADNATPGMILFDVASGQILYRYENTTENIAEWRAMTSETGTNISHGTQTENSGETGIIISDGTATQPQAVNSVLALESDEKAFVLPRVTNAVLLPSPQQGTICYDENSGSIAVFNGNKWSFWN